MSEIVSEPNIELENVFQQIFMECDTSFSTSMTYSTLSLDEEVPISRIVQYVQEQLPIWSIEHMLELWKCLSDVSTNDRVNLRQFKEATKCWIAKVLQTQDDNNNIKRKLYNTWNARQPGCKEQSDSRRSTSIADWWCLEKLIGGSQRAKSTNDTTTMDSMKTEIDKDIAEVELRMRVRKFDEENIILREELARAEDLIASLERQRNNLENQLDRYTKKCQQLERENDEQKDKLNEMMRNQKSYVSAYQRSAKKYESLSKKLEVAEIEMQAIQPLREEMEKISKEKRSCVKLVTRLQEEFYEKEEECEKLRVTMAELQDTNNSMKETYEYTISNLRERNRQLTDENMELQSWAALQGETFSLSPNPSADGCYPHSISYKLEKVSLDNSLYAELRASGFTAECSSRNSCRLELEEELGYYDTVISATLQQLDKIIQTCAERTDSTDAAQLDSPHTENTRVHNIETLKHKVALLLDTVTKKTRNRDTKNSSTQLRADCSDAIENLGQFGATSFRARLVRAHQCPRPEPDLRSTASQDAIDNEDDPFLKVIRAKASVLEDLNIIEVIDPLVDELDRIIEQTVNSPVVYKDLPASGSPRYKSIYTLPSYSRACSPGAEDARRAGSCQDSRKNPLDIALASGDGPTEASGDRKPTEFETRTKCDASGRERPSLHTEETSRRPSEIRAKKPSALRMDSETLVTPQKKPSAMNFQAPEVIVTSPLTSPLTSARRKFSVYHRSFDVVEVRDPREDDRGPCLEVRRSPSDSLVRDDGPTKFGDVVVGNEVVGDRARDQNGAASRYLFSHYRDARNDSDSSNSCSPQKRSSSDEPSPTVAQQPILRRVHLAPTRLKLPQEIESRATVYAPDYDVAKKRTKDCAPLSGSSDVPGFLSAVAVDKCEEDDDDDDASVHSSSTFIVADKCETAIGAALESNSCSASEKFSQGHLTSAPSIPYNRMDPTKIADPGDPHSRTSVRRRVDGDQPHVERSVDSQMSSREDTSADDEDSECESARPSDRCVDGGIVAMGANEAGQTANAVLPLIGSPMKKMPCDEDAVQDDGETQRDGNLLVTKQGRQQPYLMMRRSFSEGDNVNNDGQILCCCKQHDGSQTAPLIPTDSQSISFPSLTSARLRESGIANLPDTEINSRENLSEFELQKRYTAFSLCLCTDRVTLSRRMEVSLRQRDQSERNLACEVQKMQQDIQELAPLCTDRESVERVERVRHQLDMVARCAHRVSCAAETLGAVHEEHRISRAVFVADRYLQLLQSRCEKLAANVVETKRILTENNIMIEEISGELGDDLPRIRYRSGTPANNRMMMARRRASIATMSRPMGSTQDVIKDTARQRNSVSGRVTLRRPSLNYESSKWENERLGRSDSSNSICELRGIFEHAESRRGSKEENNNMLRLNQSNSQSIINCAIIDDEIWTNPKQETCTELLSVDENASRDCRPCARSTSQSFRLRGMIVSWRVMLWGILFFFLGFYVNRVVSTMTTCYTNDPVDQWLINWIFKGYVRTNVTPHPT